MVECATSNDLFRASPKTWFERQTILTAATPCPASPCIDPIFGPIVADKYWSNWHWADFDGLSGWVDFNDGSVNTHTKNFGHYVRAVRGGA